MKINRRIYSGYRPLALSLVVACMVGPGYAQQNVINNTNAILSIQGAEVFSDQGAIIQVNGDVNFMDGNILHNGLMQVTGNWANDNMNKNEAFDPASNGEVKLTTGLQEIQGYATTAFPTLSIEGWDRKVLRVNTKATRGLNLNNLELDVNGNDMWVTNSAQNAVTRGTGYVNTSKAAEGRLVWTVNGGTTYQYPLGGGTPYRYRPITAQPNENGVLASQFQNYNADNDGFDRRRIVATNYNKINDQFYHAVNAVSGINGADIKIPYNTTEDGGTYTGLARWIMTDKHWMDPANYYDAAESGEGTDRVMHYHFDDSGSHVLALIDTVMSNPTIFVVSGFTPNGDGKNDYFVIKGLENYKSNEIKIFDRWGKMVYTAANYRNDWAGNNLDMDTYMYVLKVKDLHNKEHLIKGDVTLIR